MKEKLEARIKELGAWAEDRQKSISQLIAEHNGILHRIDELKLLLKQVEEQKG